jgi:hypothetical protein
VSLPASAVATESTALTRFSPEAATEYSSRVSAYVTALERVSRIVAQQRNADDVSAHDVRLASEALGNGDKKKSKRLGELGGLIAGAGLGYLGNVVIASAYTFANGVIALLPIALGAVLYSYSAGRD